MKRSLIVFFILIVCSGCTTASNFASMRKMNKISIGMKKEQALKIAGEQCYVDKINRDLLHCQGSEFGENPVNYIPGIAHINLLTKGYENYYFDIYFSHDKVKKVVRTY